jgi:hypothetical protein
VTVVIHRLHETDPAWWREFLREIRADRNSSPVGSFRNQVLTKVLSIVEQAVQPDAASNPKPARDADGS